VRPILSLLIVVIALASCTRREPGPQDSTPAADRRERASEEEPASRGAAAADPATTAARPELTERTVDARFGFELAYPSGWTASEGPGMPALFVTSAREGASDPFVENVNVVVEELPVPMSAEAYADGSLPLMQTDLVEFREVSRGPADLGGQPAVRREYEHTFAGRPLWVVSYMVVVDKRAYVITATAERERAETWRALLESISNSFQLVTK
jgi:hypothetical protein